MKNLTKKQEQEKIEELLCTFDFEKAHALFHTMGWTYGGSSETPTVEDLKNTARELLERAMSQQSGWISTGRFKAERYDDELVLELIFDKESVFI